MIGICIPINCYIECYILLQAYKAHLATTGHNASLKGLKMKLQERIGNIRKAQRRNQNILTKQARIKFKKGIFNTWFIVRIHAYKLFYSRENYLNIEHSCTFTPCCYMLVFKTSISRCVIYYTITARELNKTGDSPNSS